MKFLTRLFAALTEVRLARRAPIDYENEDRPRRRRRRRHGGYVQRFREDPPAPDESWPFARPIDPGPSSARSDGTPPLTRPVTQRPARQAGPAPDRRQRSPLLPGLPHDAYDPNDLPEAG